MEILQIVWFSLMALLLAVFLIMGGFDFGEGILYTFAKTKFEREHLIKNILPYWDANQVWLISAAGGLFAAFPLAYSTILPALYLPIMILLVCLVLRVIAIEFYFADTSDSWKKFFGIILAFSSTMTAFVVGVALASICSGTIIDFRDGFSQNILRLFSVFGISCGILSVAFFALQGTLFAEIKSENSEFYQKAKKAMFLLMLAFILFAGSLLYHNRQNSIQISIILLVSYLMIRISAKLLKRKHLKTSFLFSSLFALCLTLGLSFNAYPYIIPPTKNTEGLLIATASSSEKTLTIMLFVALIGVPIAIGYNIYAHKVFSKPTKSE